MSAVRFPAQSRHFIVVTEQVHASETYTREVRIQVDYIVAYWPAPGGQSTVKIAGREQPVRILLSPEELDVLVRSAEPVEPAFDLASVAS